MHIGEDRGHIGDEAIIVFAQRPVDQCGSPQDIPSWHEAPVTRIVAIQTIVAKHKVLVGRNNQVVNLLLGPGIALEFGVNVGFVQGNAIDNDGGVIDGQGVARDGDNTFDVVGCGVGWSDEDDDIAPGRCVEEIGPLIHQDAFLIVQARLQTGTIDRVILHD